MIRGTMRNELKIPRDKTPIILYRNYALMYTNSLQVLLNKYARKIEKVPRKRQDGL
jgi:hypothetical protein